MGSFTLKNTSSADSPRIDFLALTSLSLGWVMIYADRVSISPLLILIQKEFNLSFSSTSLLLSVYFFSYVFFTIPAILIAERYGYKKTMVSFFLLAASSLALVGVFGTTYYSLLVLLGIHGLGAGAYYPTAFKISNEIVPPARRGFSAAIITSGIGIGTVLGLGIAGPLLAFVPRWQVVLLMLSIPTFAVGLLFFKSIHIRDNPPSKFRPGLFVTLVGNKRFVAICSMMFCSTYGYWVILSWAPALLQSVRGLDIFYSGLATGIFAAVAIPSSLIVSKYSDRVGRRGITLVLLPLASLAILTMAFASSLSQFILAIIAYGVVGGGTLLPVAVAWVGDIMEPESLGASLAVLNVFSMASSIFAPVVTGDLADLSGSLANGFYLGALVVIFGAVFLYWNR